MWYKFDFVSIYRALLSAQFFRTFNVKGGPMATFYQDAVRQIGSTESELHSFYKKLGRKDHVEFTQDLIEKTGGTRKEMASFLFRIVNCTLDCIKLLKSGCLEVDALKTESKCAMKDLAEVQNELLQCKRDQIEFIQAGVQKTIKTEIKSYSAAVQKSKGESVSLSKIKTAVKDIGESVIKFGEWIIWRHWRQW